MTMKGLQKRCSPRSAYIHIPFCYRRCFYCDFAVIPLGDGAAGLEGPGSISIKTYLNLLHREISLSPKGPPLATVYIGGGTPSLLSPFQVEELLNLLRGKFGLQDGAEVTLEMDPASFNREKLNSFLNAGINRVSVGGQSFDDLVLARLGRTHKRKDLLEVCSWLDQAYGLGKLRSWNLDLIQNLPEQRLKDWYRELSEALSTFAPHLSIYDLSVEPGTVFASLQKKGKLNLPNDEIAAEIMDLTNKTLSEAGFARYEISNYAFPGHVSRHNRVYWSGRGWWGFGQGATSAPWGERFARPRTLDGYRFWIEKQESEGLEPSLLALRATRMQLDDEVLVGLRRREGVDLTAISRDWGWNNSQSEDYLAELHLLWRDSFESGLIEVCGTRIRLTNPLGMSLSNQVFVQLLIWWESLPLDAVGESNL